MSNTKLNSQGSIISSMLNIINNFEEPPYDAIYIINLVPDLRIWNKINKMFGILDLKYTPFNLADDHNIKLINTLTHQNFTTRDITDKKIIINDKTEYKVFCTPEQNETNNFHIFSKNHRINEREIAAWCIYKNLLKDIVENNYKNAVVFYSNILPTKNSIPLVFDMDYSIIRPTNFSHPIQRDSGKITIFPSTKFFHSDALVSSDDSAKLSKGYTDFSNDSGKLSKGYASSLRVSNSNALEDKFTVSIVSKEANPGKNNKHEVYVYSVPERYSDLPKIDRSSKEPEIKAYENYLRKITTEDYSHANLNPSSKEQIKFCIVIPSYNNKKYVTQNLNSVFVQDYHNWKLAYIDDASTDGTLDAVKAIKAEGKFSDYRFKIFAHPNRIQSPAYSFYKAANNYCDDNDVMVHLDGDDMLSSRQILRNLAEIYSGGKTWITFGSFTTNSGEDLVSYDINGEPYDIPDHLDNLRSRDWITSHLRTSYTWLFRKINIEDLKYEDKFIQAASDFAMMFPMLEMAGKERTVYTKDVSYIYRIHNNNVHNSSAGTTQQAIMAKYIRSLPKYPLLQNPFLSKVDFRDYLPKIDRSSSKEDIEIYEKLLSTITDESYQNANNAPSQVEKVKFCIVSPSYNNEKYVAQHLNSILIQDYHNWRLAYINDVSSDGTLNLVKTIKNIGNFSDDKFKIFDHKERMQSPIYGFYEAAYNYCDDNEVMVHLDGDDMLASPKVLSNLAQIYSDEKIWITFGSYISTEGTMTIDASKHNISNHLDNLRSRPWLTSHLRSSYTWLFKKINAEDMKYQGNFFTTSGDVGLMFPMLEMAGKMRTKYVSEISCVYRIHPNNDRALDLSGQVKVEKYIKALPKYPLLLDNHSKSGSNMPDQVYVINLDSATKRWNDIHKRLIEADIKHIRFSATNGYKVKITNLENNEVFLGNDIKYQNKKLEKYVNYKITCNPENDNSTEFNFKGYIHSSGNPISAGELGLWCSTVLAWKDAKNNGYKTIIIFDDDIVPSPSFKKDLSNFIDHIPNDFDLAYLGYHFAGKNDTKIKVNDYVHGFTDKAYGWGSYATLFSAQAVDKLLSLQEYTYPIDNFYWCLSTGITGFTYHPASDCEDKSHFINQYASSQELLDVLRIDDETSIKLMGRTFPTQSPIQKFTEQSSLE